jgi:alpha-tubulin suppressor-like RCC1 family protein
VLGAAGHLGFTCNESVVKFPKLCSYNIQILQVACGDSHTHILSSDGFVYSMGSNRDGVLGLNQSESQLPFATAP